MSSKKISLEIIGPILSGCISVAYSRCGKRKCACKQKPARLHGPFYRWTGVLDGKRTTKTISKEVAGECERRIENYRRMQKKIDQVLKTALKNAPWNEC